MKVLLYYEHKYLLVFPILANYGTHLSLYNTANVDKEGFIIALSQLECHKMKIILLRSVCRQPDLLVAEFKIELSASILRFRVVHPIPCYLRLRTGGLVQGRDTHRHSLTRVELLL